MSRKDLTLRMEGQKPKVGDWVAFKSDIEQTAQIVKIRHQRNWAGIACTVLVVENLNGLKGEYLAGQTQTTLDLDEIF